MSFLTSLATLIRSPTLSVPRYSLILLPASAMTMIPPLAAFLEITATALVVVMDVDVKPEKKDRRRDSGNFVKTLSATVRIR